MSGWGTASLLYWGGRLLSIAIVLGFAAWQPENPYTAASPDYLSFANLWDARWFEYIAAAGYPSELPIVDGHVGENAWAFLPVYPFLVGGLAGLSGLGWPLVAVLVSLLAGWGSALVLWRLLRHFLDERRSRWALAFYCFAPVSPIFGFGYAEGLFLLLLALALLLLVERRYLALAAVLPLLAFTRPGMVSLALTLAGHFGWRWLAARRGRRRFPRRERIAVGALVLWASALGFAWLGIAGLVTGRPAGYLETELRWRAPYIGFRELIPGTPWFESGNWWLGQPWGTIVPALVAIGFLALLFTPAARRLGPDLRLWLGSYWLYLFLVFFPQSSTFRLLAPLFPVVALLAQIRAGWLRWLLLLAGIAGQALWLWLAWAVVGTDWTPP